MLSQHTLDCIAKNLTDIGAIAFDDYLDDKFTIAPSLASEPVDANAITQLHQACQRAFRNTNALKFEFIEQNNSRHKQCILTITKPNGTQRSYATRPIFVKKSEAKSEAAQIAIDMGALDFLTSGDGQADLITLAEAASTGNALASGDAMSMRSETAPETFINDIEQSCFEWRAGCVTPHWVPFFDVKSAHKQGCALRIQLSPHVVRVYLSDPTFDTYLDAKGACAKAAVLEGVLDFIKYGNGQTRPSSPNPSSSSTAPLLPPPTPWTLQGFFDSLPRPFPESFDTNDASAINAPGWLNTMVQNARGGKLVLSFFFTSDGPPGLHGCLLKLDRPGEYRAFLICARFPKRADAKAAICLQAMSEGIGNYIRSITSAVDAKVTPVMRSFSSSLVYPTLTSELSKIDANLHPRFEHNKERDAFGATLVVGLSTSPTPEQVRRYTVPSDYRNKGDAKVAIICHAAEQGVVEFIRFRGGSPPNGYTSPYILRTYNPDASRKRKQPGSAEDAEQGPPAKKKKKKKGKSGVKIASHDQGSCLTPVSIHPSSDQIHGISRPSDMSLSRSVPADGSCDASQLGVGSGGGSGAARATMYGHGVLHNAQMHVSSYHATLDPRFMGGSELGGRGYSVYAPPGGYGSGLYPPHAADVPPPESGPSRAWPGTSRMVGRPTESEELEPGEVVSSAESEFSESSSRNEDGDVSMEEQGMQEAFFDSVATTIRVDTDANGSATGRENVDAVERDKGKGKETTPTNTDSRDDSGGMSRTTTSHVEQLIEYCAMQGRGTPSFHEMECQDRFQVWIVIGQERFDLPTTYGGVEEGRQRVAKQVLARLSRG